MGFSKKNKIYLTSTVGMLEKILICSLLIGFIETPLSEKNNHQKICKSKFVLISFQENLKISIILNTFKISVNN